MFQKIINTVLQVLLFVAAFLYLFDVIDFESFAYIGILFGASTALVIHSRQLDTDQNLN